MWQKVFVCHEGDCFVFCLKRPLVKKFVHDLKAYVWGSIGGVPLAQNSATVCLLVAESWWYTVCSRSEARYASQEVFVLTVQHSYSRQISRLRVGYFWRLRSPIIFATVRSIVIVATVVGILESS